MKICRWTLENRRKSCSLRQEADVSWRYHRQSPALNASALSKLLASHSRGSSPVTPHVDEILAACAKTLFALPTLRQHGLPNVIIHIFQATVVAKLTYAPQAWWGYANAADCAHLEGFFRQCVLIGFWSASSPTLVSVCDVADDRLFSCINNDSWHLLWLLLLLTREDHYNLCERHHNPQLPAKTSTLSDNGFIKRMLYKNTGCDRSTSIIHSQ